MEKIKVCVLFITYNHANFVREALESMLIQKTTFSFKIVVGDDCSKDGTRKIIANFEARYPDKIILSNPVINLGAEKNFNQLLAKCIDIQPDYIAYLEGDDYWLDEYRLQKQFNILENNPDVGLVYGKNKLRNEQNNLIECRTPPFKSGYIFEDIILNKYLPALHSSFFRTCLIKEIFAQSNYFGLDLYIIAEMARRSKFIYVDDFFHVYRATPGSITKLQAQNVKNQFNKVLNLYKKDYPGLVKKGLNTGNKLLLYNQIADNPSFSNLWLLIKYYEFSFMHQRQIIKWFFLKLKKLF